MKSLLTIALLFAMSNKTSAQYTETTRERYDQAIGIAAEKIKSKTKILFNNSLYNYEAIHLFDKINSLACLEVITDATSIRQLTGIEKTTKGNDNITQVIKIVPKTNRPDWLSEMYASLKPYLYNKLPE
ncbi:MAG: hypothetical protein ABWZ25_00980 [Chitinophagaceae bacterium]